ncbi:MAG: helix-turn-helix transcriptional regulator [Lawsonibacter sp.]|nr:helix-turn-helix transcriptional regulator [Lawsonibacter sp.]
MSVFSERLIQMRKSRGISQSAFAKAIGVSPRTYQDYEYGTREPQVSIFVRIADFYDVSLDYLVGRSEQRER